MTQPATAAISHHAAAITAHAAAATAQSAAQIAWAAADRAQRDHGEMSQQAEMAQIAASDAQAHADRLTQAAMAATEAADAATEPDDDEASGNTLQAYEAAEDLGVLTTPIAVRDQHLVVIRHHAAAIDGLLDREGVDEPSHCEICGVAMIEGGIAHINGADAGICAACAEVIQG